MVSVYICNALILICFKKKHHTILDYFSIIEVEAYARKIQEMLQEAEAENEYEKMKWVLAKL